MPMMVLQPNIPADLDYDFYVTKAQDITETIVRTKTPPKKQCPYDSCKIAILSKRQQLLRAHGNHGTKKRATSLDSENPGGNSGNDVPEPSTESLETIF